MYVQNRDVFETHLQQENISPVRHRGQGREQNYHHSRVTIIHSLVSQTGTANGK